MSELEKILQDIVKGTMVKMIISKPADKSNPYKKIVIERKREYFQAAKYTEKQVFHDNVKPEGLYEYLTELILNAYLQVNAWDMEKEHIILLSKKGKVTYKTKMLPKVQKTVAVDSVSAVDEAEHAQQARENAEVSYTSHNRKKNYILEEGQIIPPLVDMGVFTKEGKVVKSMYDKFRQINRFIEMIDDGVRDYQKDEIHIIDFGCGKSYLTFIMYYYFTEVRHMKVQMLGLDLKEDVICKCNETAQKYGYDNLRFEMGNINGFKTPFDVEMVVTLHACDVATDFAIAAAVNNGAKVCAIAPCCHKEFLPTIGNDEMPYLFENGIFKKRFSDLLTDIYRVKTLEEKGYNVTATEFVSPLETPKNLLILAEKKEKETVTKEKKSLVTQ